MVTTQFNGRLGNSMFQIAAIIGYARKYGCDWGVPSFARESGIHNCWPNLPRCDNSMRRIQEHPAEICKQHGVHYDLCHYDYHDLPNYGDNVCLVGFWQSWKYFQNVQEEVKKTFPLAHVPGYEDYVSIHVRRGDYVQYVSSFPPITKEYIALAIIQMGLKGVTSKKLIFFSDDIQWCKENFKGEGDILVEYSEGRGELQDLSLMASCGHHIIANSSYSYWGAWLGHNPDRVVVAPSCKRGNWYGWESGIKKDCIDLLPPNWHQIEFR